MKKILLVIIIVVTSLNGVLAKRKQFSCITMDYKQSSDSNVEVKLCAKITQKDRKVLGLSKRVASKLQESILEQISSERVSNNKGFCYPCPSSEGIDNGSDGCGLDPLDGIDKILEGPSNPDYI
jgi:hypothetical protein